jgi:hypothetical protein
VPPMNNELYMVWLSIGTQSDNRVLSREREDTERLAQYVIRSRFSVRKMRLRTDPPGETTLNRGLTTRFPRRHRTGHGVLRHLSALSGVTLAVLGSASVTLGYS